MTLASRFALSLLTLVPIAQACSSSSPAAAPTGPTVRFNAAASPGFMEVPFPSDVYLSGGKVMEIPGMDAVVKENANYLSHEIAKQDGFSRAAMALFYVDDTSKGPDDNGEPTTAEIDPKSLPVSEADSVADTSSVFLVDLTATDPTKARVAARAQFHHPKSTKTRPVIGVGPARGVMLAEGHQYAAVVTSRVKDLQGRPLLASADFAALQAGKASPLTDVYAPALDKLKAAIGGALAGDKATVVAIAPYTTNKMSSELYKTRDWLEDQPTPTLKWDAGSLAPMGAVKFALPDMTGKAPMGFVSTDDWLGKSTSKLMDGSDDPDSGLKVRAHDKIAALGTAEFDAINFMQEKGGYDTIDHHTFAHDAMGNVIPAPEKPTDKIWLTVAIPTAPMPAGGYPVVIVQHGLSGSREYLLELANPFCNAGWAVVAIDSVTFGARAPEKEFQNDAANNFAGSYAGPDGFADPVMGATNGSSDFFGSLLNIGALRDQLRQAALDTAQVVKVLKSSPDLSALQTGMTPPKFDATKIAYIGDSLGGIEGATSAAIEPSVSAWVLNVAGGGLLTDLGPYSPVISKQLGLAGGFNFAFQADVFTPAHPMVTLVQTVAELGDPIVYADAIVTHPQPLKGMATKPRNVIQTEVLFDEIVANEAGEALARAAGFALATPNVGSNAELSDLKNPDGNPHKITFQAATPDGAGSIHDAPVMGVTAVLVQTGPGTHGEDLVHSQGTRSFVAPWAQYDTGAPYTPLDTMYKVKCDYLGLQAMARGFFGDAFAGKVPGVSGFKPAVRDLDDDGNPDATDPDPNNPMVK